ncbi:MAG: FKBP-type peptidyl-prolyl cis-trans isomerase [Deltaproteobacteria bacterium]|nr:FKBP-type peptidyl-prolyl cis-trans isomerase [Deltaproteobacteria bacterium]
MRITPFAAVLSAGLLSVACSPQKSAPPEPKTEDEKTLYAIGLMEAQKLGVFVLSPTEVGFVERGLHDGVTGAKPLVDLTAYRPKINELVKARASVRAEAEKAKAEVEKTKGKEFAEKAAKDGAQALPSGLVYKDTEVGTGASPAASDTVKVHYRGTLIDGTEFDSSHKRNQPAEFRLDGVIKCWTEGVQKMKVGGKARLVCPSAIAYGDNGRPPTIPGGATLVFDIDLLEIKAPPAPPPSAPALPTPPPTPPPTAAPKK